jgi:hypothetical protein
LISRSTILLFAGQVTLPAGTYTVRPVPDAPDVLETAGAATGEPSVMVEVVDGTTDLTDKNVHGTQMEFNKFGDKMALTQEGWPLTKVISVASGLWTVIALDAAWIVVRNTD